MAPVAPLGLMVGKMIPYGVLAFGELCAILIVMTVIFQVPIHGNVFLLLALSVPFLLTVLGLGLVIDARKNTGGGFPTRNGHGATVGVFVRLYLSHREHAEVLPGYRPAHSRNLLHPDSAQQLFCAARASAICGCMLSCLR